VVPARNDGGRSRRSRVAVGGFETRITPTPCRDEREAWLAICYNFARTNHNRVRISEMYVL
jgi:hypothetical protein